MEDQDINKSNQFVEFLETGKDIGNAVKAKEIIDVRKALRAKYPNVPIPSADRIVRKISIKQQRGIKRE